MGRNLDFSAPFSVGKSSTTCRAVRCSDRTRCEFWSMSEWFLIFSSSDDFPGMAERAPVASGLNLDDDIPLADVDGEEVKDSSPDGPPVSGIKR